MRDNDKDLMLSSWPDACGIAGSGGSASKKSDEFSSGSYAITAECELKHEGFDLP
jgi:hypothetical protein